MNWNNIKHLYDLNRDINENLVLFIGAGASIAAPSSLPSFLNLRNTLIKYLFNGLCDLNSCKDELLETRTKPELILQTIWEYMGNKINPISGFQFAVPNLNHHYIALLCSMGVRIIVTTNFDKCIEGALDYYKFKYKVIVGAPQNEKDFFCIKKIFESKSDEVVVWKTHGDVEIVDSLCYTIEQVAKLNNSIYVKQIYELLLSSHNFLMLGYSGYDDDFFPILYNYPDRCQDYKTIYWNLYEKLKENTPPYNLKKRWKNNIKFLYGDMQDILKHLYKRSIEIPNLNEKFNWEYYLQNEINRIEIQDKILIIGKYCFLLSKLNIAEIVWKYGIGLPNISRHNKMRLITNTSRDNNVKVYVFSEAIKLEYYQVAFVTLTNLISSYNKLREYEKSNTYLQCYKKLHNTHQQFFPYYMYIELYEEYLSGKYRNNHRIFCICKELQKKVMELLWEKGDIINFVLAYSKYISKLAANYYYSIEDYTAASSYLPLLEAYNIPDHLSELYYSLAILASHLSKKTEAVKFIKLSESYLKIAYEIGVYDETKYKVLLSIIKHEFASYGTAHDAIYICKQCLEIIDSIKDCKTMDRSKEEYFGIYCTSIAYNYVIVNKLDKAQEYASQSLRYHQMCHNLQGQGRAFLALGRIYGKMKMKEKAFFYYQKSLDILKHVGENTERIKKEMSEL